MHVSEALAMQDFCQKLQAWIPILPTRQNDIVQRLKKSKFLTPKYLQHVQNSFSFTIQNGASHKERDSRHLFKLKK